MFKVVKVVVNRFIEWLVTRSSGDTMEKKLLSSLTTVSFICCISMWLILTLVIVNVNMRIRLSDTEHAASMVRKIFEPENNPLDQFAKINQELSRHLNNYRDENIILIKDNLHLVEQNDYLTQENNLLSLEVNAMKEKSNGNDKSSTKK